MFLFVVQTIILSNLFLNYGNHCAYAWSSTSRPSSHPTRKLFIESIPKLLLRPTIITATASAVTTIHPTISNAYDPDPDKLRESLYLISRVQEATVQQERLITNTVRTKLSQEELKSKLTLSLRLVDRSYKLIDQINYTSQFVAGGGDDLVTATNAGLEAVEALQSAIDYVKLDLKGGSGSSTEIRQEQRDYLVDALRTTREELFTYVKYMPQDKLEQARLRIERENVDNRDEFDGPSDSGVYNPVKLPWK